jgi:serine/threonine-protein kinase
MEPFVIARYRCIAPLGEGGMGMVYKAQHLEMDRVAAVKVLLPQAVMKPEAVARFRREAHLASQIVHPNSVLIYDYGDLGPMFYLAMEFIQGRSLADVLEPKGAPHAALPLGRAVEIARQIAGALDAAHKLGIVHRDIKPQNVMVCDQADGDLVKVVDFGIARSVATADPTGFQTLQGMLVGTPAYMSPEQASGDPDVDTRTDVFSFALIVYQMLAGRLPFTTSGLTPLQQVIQRAILRDHPPPLRQLCPDLPAGVEAAVMRALEPDRLRRTPSAGQFAEELVQAAA